MYGVIPLLVIMVKTWLYRSDERTAELRYSNTAVGLHCADPLKVVEKTRVQRNIPRARASGLRAHRRAPLRAHALGASQFRFVIGSDLGFFG